MYKLFLKYFLLCTALLLAVACINVGTGDLDSSSGSGSSGNNGGQPDVEEEKEIVYASKTQLQLNWVKAEIIRTEGPTGYASLFGIVRVKKAEALGQEVYVHYHDGNSWQKVKAQSKGISDDPLFLKFYFYTPEIPVDLTLPDGKVVPFKLQYKFGNEVLWGFNKYKKEFQVNCLTGKEVPSALLGGNHILVEKAVLTPVRNAENELTHYLFKANVHIKQKDDVKEVRLNYKPNIDNDAGSDTWSWGYVDHNVVYPHEFFSKTGNTFKGFAYVDELDEWAIECEIPLGIYYIQFVFVEELKNGTRFMDKNRCRRYWMTPDPEKPVELQVYATY